MKHAKLASVLVGLVLVAGCSSGGSGGSADAGAKTGTKAEAEQASDSGDADAFCDLFADLAAQREAKGEGGVKPGSTEAVPDSAEGWDQRIEITSDLAAAAPPDSQDEGATYVELVTARAQLFADHGYPASLADIPAADTQAFISDHVDEQQIANTFIEFAKTQCGVA